MESLDPDPAERNLLAAAKLAGEGASGLEIKKIEWRNGIKQFVKAISDKCDNPVAEGVKWRNVGPGDLDELGKFFTTKDIQFLEAQYRDYHEVMPSEIEDIVKKAIDLSED